jgi:nucleoside-diphosphate-sugar epimerase
VNVVITGGAGFLGSRLAAELSDAGTIAPAGAPPAPISRIDLVDRVPLPASSTRDPRLLGHVADLVGELEADAPHPLDDADVVFHLAAAVSGECERDFDLGLRTNLRGTELILERCRTSGRTPVVVFASSIAVFGATATHPLPEIVTDETLPVPQSSYGIQKFVGEQLVADYTRRGFVRGRSVRVMTVSVRPGRPNGAASSFLSGIIREPLAGEPANCPVPPDTVVALSSPARAVEGLLRAATATADEWGDPTAVNLPAITLTVGEMVDVLAEVAGPAARALVSWEPDPQIAAIVAGWPARFAATRAAGLGLLPDPDFASVVRSYRAEQP